MHCTHEPYICTYSTHKHAHSRTHKRSQCTLTRAHRHAPTRVHTHWDLSFLPPRRLRGLQGNRSQVPTRERDALPTGAPDSPLSPRSPRKPGTRLLPGAQEGCPRAAFSLEELPLPSGFHPPSTGHHTHGHPQALREARLCPGPHSKGSQGWAAHPRQTNGRRAEPTMHTSALAVVLTSTLPAGVWRGPRAWHTVSPLGWMPGPLPDPTWWGGAPSALLQGSEFPDCVQWPTPLSHSR